MCRSMTLLFVGVAHISRGAFMFTCLGYRYSDAVFLVPSIKPRRSLPLRLPLFYTRATVYVTRWIACGSKDLGD